MITETTQEKKLDPTDIIKRYKLMETAKMQAIQKHLKQYWFDRISEDSTIMDKYIPRADQKDYHQYMSKRQTKRYKYIMFTVNFKEDIPIAIALKKIKKYTKKVWIQEHLTCLEWRSTDTGMHMHSRVTVIPDKNPYHTKREVYNTFKNLVGNPMHVNVRYSNRDNAFEKYIHGYKDGVYKDTHKVTVEMRQKYKLPPILTFK